MNNEEKIRTQDEIVRCYDESVEWLSALKEVDDDVWLEPMKEGKWSIGETISHMLKWDEFILKERLPVMVPGATLKSAKIDVDAFNHDAAAFARSGITKDDLIDSFITVRRELIARLKEYPEEDFQSSFQINNRQWSLQSYFHGMVNHDKHHQVQIEQFLEAKKNSFA